MLVSLGNAHARTLLRPFGIHNRIVAEKLRTVSMRDEREQGALLASWHAPAHCCLIVASHNAEFGAHHARSRAQACAACKTYP